MPYMVTMISKFQEKSVRLTWDGNIQGDLHDRESGKDDSLSPSIPPESTRPLGGEENHTQITIPFDPTQVADLQENFGHEQGDIEIQQLESYQCRHNNGPYIQIPVDSHQQLLTPLKLSRTTSLWLLVVFKPVVGAVCDSCYHMER